MNLKRLWGTGLVLAVAVGLVVFAGCSKDKTTGPASIVPQEENLNTPTGGLTTTNEQPGFGDPNLIASVGEEVPQVDQASQDPGVLDIEAGRTTGAKVYSVTILWGMLQDPGSGDAVGANQRDGDQYDWSGSADVSQGMLVLKSAISFEPGDHMILPRPNLGTLEWDSHTGTGYDGIRFLVYEPSALAGADEPTFTFRTPLYNTTIPVASLADMDTLITVDQNGNRVHIMAIETKPGASIRGTLRGHWEPLTAGTAVGHFSGLWITDRGDIWGFVKGHYGVDAQGRKVFFGKYVDRSGVFQGFLRGTWGVSRDDMTTNGQIGWFLGSWLEAGLTEKGQLKGIWATTPEGKSFFDGHWCIGCNFGSTSGS